MMDSHNWEIIDGELRRVHGGHCYIKFTDNPALQATVRATKFQDVSFTKYMSAEAWPLGKDLL